MTKTSHRQASRQSDGWQSNLLRPPPSRRTAMLSSLINGKGLPQRPKKSLKRPPLPPSAPAAPKKEDCVCDICWMRPGKRKALSAFLTCQTCKVTVHPECYEVGSISEAKPQSWTCWACSPPQRRLLGPSSRLLSHATEP